jgi:hypothetical protein
MMGIATVWLLWVSLYILRKIVRLCLAVGKIGEKKRNPKFSSTDIDVV